MLNYNDAKKTIENANKKDKKILFLVNNNHICLVAATNLAKEFKIFNIEQNLNKLTKPLHNNNIQTIEKISQDFDEKYNDDFKLFIEQTENWFDNY